MSTVLRFDRFLVVGTGLCLVASSALQAQGLAQPDSKVTDPHFKLAPGYLQQMDLPDSLMLLGPPPAKDSAAFSRDEEARQSALAIKESARWHLARQDADLVFPRPAQNFSCAMGESPRVLRRLQALREWSHDQQSN